VAAGKDECFMVEVTEILARRSGHQFKADVTGQTEVTLVVGIFFDLLEKGGPIGTGDRVGIGRVGVGRVVDERVVGEKVGDGVHVGQAML